MDAGRADAPGMALQMRTTPANPFNYTALTRALVVDSDGIDATGIRLPEVTVPSATRRGGLHRVGPRLLPN